MEKTIRKKRPFYIVAHNPNSLEETKDFLEKGVNALEPDVINVDGTFYISHLHLPSYSNTHTLAEYLQGLKKMVEENGYNLNLIIFDIKDTDFNINDLIAQVKDNFSGGACDGVAMLFTHSDATDFVMAYDKKYENVGIGVDESNVPPRELDEMFRKAGHSHYTYSDGVTTLLVKPGVYENIVEAQNWRDAHQPSFKLIYTWAITREATLKKFLDTYIDGIFVDPGDVAELRKLIDNDPYNQVFELAQNGYNPFTAAPIPKYRMKVETSDTFLAGTDAKFLFTLYNGEGQSLQSLPYDSSARNSLERNTVTLVSVEGADIGAIERISIEAISSDISGDWLPERITVKSPAGDESVFVFNTEGKDAEWIKKENGAITKTLVRQL